MISRRKFEISSDDGCSTDPLDFPMLTQAPYGFLIAAVDATAAGAYAAQVSSCPLTQVALGDSRTGNLGISSCTAADGGVADWYLLRAPADIVRFNSGPSGQVDASFDVGGLASDVLGSGVFFGSFSDDPSQMFAFGADLAMLLRVAASTPAAGGRYTLSVDPPSLRQ